MPFLRKGSAFPINIFCAPGSRTIHLQKIVPFLCFLSSFSCITLTQCLNRPQLVRARLVSLNKSCFFDSARSASTPKHFSPIFCCFIPTGFDACSLFLFLYAICFHFQWKYIFINLSFFIGSFREKTFKTS